MKIAVSTTDGRTVCGQLGNCTEFLIFESEGGEIVKREHRKMKACYPIWCDSGPSNKLNPFLDCQAVISLGMGQGLYDGLVSVGIMPVLTSESNPEDAVRRFLSGGIAGARQSGCSCGNH